MHRIAFLFIIWIFCNQVTANSVKCQNIWEQMLLLKRGSTVSQNELKKNFFDQPEHSYSDAGSINYLILSAYQEIFVNSPQHQLIMFPQVILFCNVIEI